MIRLAIDTSSPVSSVALQSGNGEILCRELDSRDTHSQTLQRAIDEIVSESSLTALADIQGVAVGLGPGSFTGIRIGLSYAKGLAWSLKVPLVGVGSFEAVAQGAAEGADWIAVLSDARRAECFFAAWRRTPTGLLPCEQLGIVPVTEIEGLLSAHAPASSWHIIDAGVVGDILSNMISAPASNIATGVMKLSTHVSSPPYEGSQDIEPLYVRAVSALSIADRRERGMLP